MSAYYNDRDPQVCAWLRELIAQGHLPAGDVDERSILDVSADELTGYTQHHFFAGIGGWAYALRLAGWPDDRPVLTGSPPCQPFSAAGKGLGVQDERHLAPAFLALVAALRPPVVLGEQVAAAVRKDNWLDDLLDALEGQGYATGAIVLPACGVGAPHIRQRLWVVGRLGNAGTPGLSVPERQSVAGSGRRLPGRAAEQPGGASGRVADAMREQQRPRRGAGRQGAPGDEPGSGLGRCGAAWAEAEWLPCRDDRARPVKPGLCVLAHGVPARVGRLRGYGNAIVPQVAVEIIRELM